MNEQYTSVYFLPENLYAAGAPVIVSAGALLKDNQTGNILAQLKLTNIQYKTIKAVKVRLFLKDVMGQPMGGPLDYQYLDLQIFRDGDFGMNELILLPDVTTRVFTAEVVAVVFSDNTIWMSDDAQWDPIPAQTPLHSQYDQHVIEQLRLEQGGIWQFVFQKHKDLWRCTCGAVNHEGETRCHGCGIQQSLFHSLDVQGLTERAYERLNAEAQRAAEEKAAAEAQKKKTVKLLKIVIPVMCIVLVFAILLNLVIIPNGKYKKAMALMDAGKYEEAIVGFENMDGYKESDSMVVECFYRRAVAFMKDGQYDFAYDGFVELGNYKDSPEQATECRYQIALEQINAGQYSAAITELRMLGNYRDCSQLLTQCYKDALGEDTYQLISNAKVGDTIFFGSFEQDNDTKNGAEPIEWCVEDVKDGKILLVSRYGLRFMQFGSKFWPESSIRIWTNDAFYNGAFTDGQRTVIIPTFNAGEYGFQKHGPSKDATDYIFLLSEKQAISYFKYNGHCNGTAYAYATLGKDSSFKTEWWLRTPWSDVTPCLTWSGDGIHGAKTNSVCLVRPAMWVGFQYEAP
ncbi:MAG: hypothetical protein IKW50_06700 [Oscillospiraceae bacterium]|nr:hypothetical protein [Oscillospiraceae bacterium]